MVFRCRRRAVENEITDGITDTTFEPETSLSRQEMAVFLYRYIQSQGAGLRARGPFRSLLRTATRSPSGIGGVSYCAMNDFCNRTAFRRV
jgi:hypothetical protein